MLADGSDSWTWRWPSNEEIAWGVGLFVLTAGLSVLVTGWILVNLPPDYFRGPTAPPFWNTRHPFLRWFGRVGKNLLGAILVIVGIILALPGVPGQGVLTILIGVMFLDIPGKRKLEQRLVQWPRVLGTINALRRRFRRPELVFDSTSDQHDR
jgi:hypothetical protein